MKPYQQVPVRECAEPLVKIPITAFAVESPHPYVKLGAPYGDKSPYYLREGVLQRLLFAQEQLQQQRPQWRIQIFDAYRPIAVQQFMVDYTLEQITRQEGLELEALTQAQRHAILERVYQFWAVPSLDPASPPPHSTGAAIDVTLVDAQGEVIDMGSLIDEMSPRSYPDHYATTIDSSEQASEQALKQNNRIQFHQNRLLLRHIMLSAGFEQHPKEWWHFSYGDQLWAWLKNHKQPSFAPSARYGTL